MKLLGATGSHVGNVRETNQDRVYFRAPVAALADGMGGHQGGERAAELAIERFEVATADQPDDMSLSESDLVELVLQANREVHGHAHDNGLPGMGTTVVALTLHADDTITVANVGDSRAYWLRGDLMGQITEDHSFVEDLVRQGRLTPQEAAIHPQRNILTRAIGIGAEVEVDSFPIPEPEIGDRFLLCSDGLFNELQESEILEILLDSENPHNAAISLVEAALRTPCRDNVKVAVVELVADDDPRLDIEVETQITVETEDHDVQASVVTAPLPVAGLSKSVLQGPPINDDRDDADVAAADADNNTETDADGGDDGPDRPTGGDGGSLDDGKSVSTMNGLGGTATLVAESEGEADEFAGEQLGSAPTLRADGDTTELRIIDEPKPAIEPRSNLLIAGVSVVVALVVLIGGYFLARSIALSGSHIAENEAGGLTVFEGRPGGFLVFDPEPVADHGVAVSSLTEAERLSLSERFDTVADAEDFINGIEARLEAEEDEVTASETEAEADQSGTGQSQGGTGDEDTNDSTDLQGGSSSDQTEG